MDKWRQICAHQAARLKSALELSKHALALAGYSQVPRWVSPKDVEVLEKARQTINKKLPRLENGEFHIAVVGMEKAGKSSFINAWLESDLLPNKQTRCTFTTTKLHSVDSAHKQCLKVLPKNREEFAELLAILEDQAKTGSGDIRRNANDDLKMINQHQANMDEVIANGEQTLPFSTLEDIQDDLYKYAADERYAHAIKQLDLYTTSLASMDGILFYDVPGLNSGLSKHKIETERMLADSDAVIVIKSIISPTIEDSEKQILEYARLGDESVPLRDKMFFFISRIDMLPTRENFLSNKKDFLEQLDSFEIDSKKVVFGTATTVLFLKNRLKDRMVMANPEKLKPALKDLLDLPDDSDETIIAAAGLAEMRQKIENYLAYEREEILRTATNSLVSQIESAARNIYEEVRKHVPVNPTDARREHDREINRAFEDWLDSFLRSIEAQLEKDNSAEIVTNSIAEMNEIYEKLAEEKIANLKLLQADTRDEFFSSQIMQYGQDYANLNTTLRTNLYDNELLRIINDLSLSLSSDLHGRLVNYMDSLSQYFKDSIDVRTIIMDYMDIKSPDAYQKHLESAMGALYLRYARPLSEALIRFRHGVKDRIDIAKSLSSTLRTLSDSYPDDAPGEYANLCQYIGRGFTENFGNSTIREGAKQAASSAGKNISEKLARKVVGAVAGGAAAGPAGAVIGTIAADAAIDGAEKLLSRPSTCNSLEDVTSEVEADREALKHYLAKAVFECSGIGEFARNELGHIRRGFIASKNRLRADAKTAYDYNDPRFMELVPSNLRQKECDTRISDLLHQLSIAFQHRQIETA